MRPAMTRPILSRTLIAAAALAIGLGLAPRAVRAEGCPDDSAEQGEKKQGKFHIEYINGKPVTVIDTVVSVCGKVPRPSVVYVLTAKNIDYEWESLKQDFMPLILATVKKAPF
jgi:hypothetical protein